MFNNIGRKIQGIASFFAIFGICISILLGILFIIVGAVNGSDGVVIFLGIIFACLGSLISWFSWFLVYGFGTLIDNSQALVNIAKTLEAEYQSKNDDLNDAFCTNCGTPYLNDSNFCTNCGNSRSNQ